MGRGPTRVRVGKFGTARHFAPARIAVSMAQFRSLRGVVTMVDTGHGTCSYVSRTTGGRHACPKPGEHMIRSIAAALAAFALASFAVRADEAKPVAKPAVESPKTEAKEEKAEKKAEKKEEKKEHKKH